MLYALFISCNEIAAYLIFDAKATGVCDKADNDVMTYEQITMLKCNNLDVYMGITDKYICETHTAD